MTRRIDIPYEQAVYGSFPFWDRGYAILAHSPGCRPEWLAGLRAACQRFGERGAGTDDAPALFALRLRLEREPERWLIVGVSPQGRDDRGRPGALAFHALFIDPHDYRKAGADPFAFAGLLRDDWSAATEAESLSSGVCTLEPVEHPPLPPPGSQVESIAAILVRRGRVAIQSPEPIDAVARQVWSALPLAVRCRSSVATWAFGNGNQFDLVALPRLAGIELDASYIVVDPTSAGGAPAPDGSFPRVVEDPTRQLALGLPRVRPILGFAALLLGAGLGLIFRSGGDEKPPLADSSAEADPSSRNLTPDPAPAPPSAVDYRAEPVAPEEQRRVTEGLIDLAERFGTLEAGDPARQDPGALMAAIARRLRYRGPWLSPTELAALAGEKGAKPGTDHDRTLALEWHARTCRFATNRPLPANFRNGPLLWQLDTLAWSFHLDEDRNQEGTRRRTPAEIPHALADTLAVDVSLAPNRLAKQYPALTAYREFLSRLPRR